jgi:hypothetical protein
METGKDEKCSSWKDLLAGEGKDPDFPAVVADLVSIFVAADLYKGKDRNGIRTFTDFKMEKNDLADSSLFALWECMFNGGHRDEDAFVGLGKMQKKKLESEFTVKKKILTILTNDVLGKFRNVIVVNDRFVLKCIEHELDSVLFHLLDAKDFYKVDISTETLTDLYLMLASEVGNVTLFSKFAKEVSMEHLLYALTFATYDFLVAMYKMKKAIPDLRKNLLVLDTMTRKDAKQERFLEMVKRDISH